MKIKTRDFRVKPDSDVDLAEWPTAVAPFYDSKAGYEARLVEHVNALRKLQPKLYADNKRALLIIFQAMDAAGKDGAIKHIMSGVNPQGVTVTSFRHPGPDVLAHDFLWNAARKLPERGRIGIFNRSYYEEVLIVRVHPELLAAESLPDDTLKDHSLWDGRFRSIRGLERHLDANGTRILKFFLHLSNEEQRKRFLARLDEPEKNWKFNDADVRERNYWDAYMKAYEDCLAHTSTRHAPWFVIPADDKPNARLIISHIIIDALGDMAVDYPKVDAKRRQELRAFRRMLGEEASKAADTGGVS
jgi:PPK2 family polyphosphate:nucleotide phosphotransferase